MLNCKVIRPEVTEVTAIGAAYLAGLATGFWKNVDDIKSQWKVNKAFSSENNVENKRIRGWKQAIKAAIANTEQ